MKVQFKYAIGECVTTRTMRFLCEETCQAFTIVERYMQQSDGGMQLHYRLRAVEPPAGFGGRGASQVTQWPADQAILARCLPEGELRLFPEASKAIYGGEVEGRRRELERRAEREAKARTKQDTE